MCSTKMAHPEEPVTAHQPLPAELSFLILGHAEMMPPESFPVLSDFVAQRPDFELSLWKLLLLSAMGIFAEGIAKTPCLHLPHPEPEAQTSSGAPPTMRSPMTPSQVKGHIHEAETTLIWTKSDGDWLYWGLMFDYNCLVVLGVLGGMHPLALAGVHELVLGNFSPWGYPDLGVCL